MSAEPKQNTTNEMWTQWEGKVVNGAFPLNRFLGGTSHSGVYLTEHFAEKRPNVTIKLIPADSVHAETQLMQWAATTTLAHESLVRIFDVGRHRFDGREFLYVVTEYGDQTLAEILPRRPLAIEEVRELVLPTLDALIFLHRRGLIHGRLKPTNFLAVDDRLKLSSDSIRPIVHSAATGTPRTSAYDPPELKERGMNAAGDIWGLGMTLLEALTQRTTAWPDDTVSLPADLPEPFTSILLKCLSVAPSGRPTVLDLEALFNPGVSPKVRLAPPPPKAATVPQPPRKPHGWRRAVTATLPIALIGWAFYHVFGNKPTPPAPPPVAAPTPAPVAPPVVAEKPAEQPELPAPAPPPAASIEATDVIQEVTPDVPQATLDRIRGRIHVTVRVLVDSEGDVIGTMMDNPGPNPNLASLADQAASEWKFVPAPRAGTRVWSLLFVFSRDGIDTRAIAQ